MTGWRRLVRLYALRGLTAHAAHAETKAVVGTVAVVRADRSGGFAAAAAVEDPVLMCLPSSTNINTSTASRSSPLPANPSSSASPSPSSFSSSRRLTKAAERRLVKRSAGHRHKNGRETGTCARPVLDFVRGCQWWR